MKTLITGANGYIGNHLIAAVLERGHQVNAFLLENTALHQLEDLPVQVFTGDIRREQDLEAAVEGCDTVFHLASKVGIWAPNPNEFHEVNVLGTDRLLLTCLRKGVRRVVLVSSCGIFGFSEKGQVLDERTQNSSPLTDPYERSKYQQVQVGKKYLTADMEVVIVYLTKVYGPGIKSNGNSVTGIFEGILNGTWRIIPGNGNTTANFAYVDDVVKGLLKAMDYGEHGGEYILGGENLSYHQLFDLVKQTTGRNFQLWHLPYPMMWLIGLIEEIRAKLTGGQPFVTRFAAKKFTTDALVACEKAQREIGYTITPAPLAVRETLEAIKSQKTNGRKQLSKNMATS